MDKFILEAQEKFLSSFPLSFFSSSNYNGPASELQFSMWQEAETLRAKNKRDIMLVTFLDLLTEARKKWLEEEILKLKKCLSGQKIDYGHDCYEHACRYCENAVIDSTLEDQISRLEAELKALNK